MPRIQIGSRVIGTGHPPFIVCEAGINHNGELDKAFEMIRVARQVGADAIKFQTFKAEEFVADPLQTYTYTSQGREVTESMLEMFQRYEFSRQKWHQIKERCDQEGILFLSTPQNPTDLELLMELGIPAIKVGSDDFTNLPLLRHYAETDLPMILSCGMSDLAEAHQALNALGALDGYPTLLLACTSQYPTPPEDANLRRIQTLASAFPMVPIGFSDHTQGPTAALMAATLGACFFEKHFTLDRDLPGPDHWFSEDPTSLGEWVRSIRMSRVALGDGIVRPTATERQNKREFQRVIVAARDLSPGDEFTADTLRMMRVPGGEGLTPALYDQILGRRSTRAYRQGEPIQL